MGNLLHELKGEVKKLFSQNLTGWRSFLLLGIVIPFGLTCIIAGSGVYFAVRWIRWKLGKIL